ncbi:peptidase M13 [Microbacterium sp. zg.Y1090]|uniref:M13 family metallopeptidase n=1 Tax=Microbacterium TaxID=33882 RepID=UPI00214C9060|nr:MULTISPECIES: M13-type metalloendopeptidase [unclassified Microbacterium]MCR2813217.1 peptidase M13 [Microbacterium sp. zg.Y1084]MCR2819530.1 peptidase M13 [Microbacterium sp. zg.Y1090]MDL5487384.1 M13-type metalloendopeptidase [Microbacterium sp. zg-Y1211]WIM28500.1 M13-type metalloendopeptidase [Microbacterium sp. zg-Y1090]
MTDALPSGLALDDLSPEIRPQDDLFRHVNGAWLDRTEIPEDKARWGSFHLLAEQAEQHVRAIVDESQDAEPGTEARKIGDLYTSFMDTERIAALGAEPLQALLSQVDAVTTVPELLSTVGRLERDGVGSFFGIYIEPDPGNPERYVPFVLQNGLSLPDESYYRLESFAETRAAHRAHIHRILEMAGVADAGAQADRVVALETELASHHWDNVRSRDAVATYNLKTWDEVRALVGVDLDPWREAVAPGHDGAFAELNVNQPSYLEGLGSVLTEERLEDWKAWLRFQIVHSMAAFLSDDFVEENFSFYGTQLTGVPVNRERWKRGVGLVEAALGEAVGKVYVERHFPPEAKTAMDELVANLVEAYRRSISGLEWMSPETRERALAKLEAFTPKIGYPVKWKDYATLEIDPTDLVGNVRRAHVWEHDRQLARVGQPIDRDEWYMTPQTVNAYYNPLMNEIVFPAAILQYPFFDAGRDAAANYGGIGAVIGHEIGHGFDDQGSRFDGDGSLRDWWTDADRAAFEERTKNLIAQYDALVPVGLSAEHHVNGALTIGENIGDLGGLGIALKAYALSLGTDEDGIAAEAPVIDGYTGIQRLLMSWAQVWEQKSRDAETIRLLTIDPHSPNEFRCNQIVRNIDAFYDAFDVTEGDALWMPPADRVTIW